MTMHKIAEMDNTKIADCVMKARKIALATIHNIYDDMEDEEMISDVDLNKVKKAMQILEIGQHISTMVKP